VSVWIPWFEEHSIVKFSSVAVGCVLLLSGMLGAQTVGDDSGLTRRHNPWGRFQPGAWTLVRVTTESFGEDDTLRSVTETRTTLTAVDEESVTLTKAVGVLVGGKQIETDPQTVSQGVHGEVSTNEPKVDDLGEGEVLVENRVIPCRILQFEFPRPVGRKVTKIYYTDSVDPYIIKRETALYAEEAETPTSETTLQVVALEAPCRLLRNFRTAARVKSVRKDASGTTTTWSWTSSLVPGGVICFTEQQVDNEGRLVRRSSLQLLDYGLQESSGRSRIFWRGRRSRGR
jgi:hypothetical protein